jgi:hypothetical protein
MARKSKTVDVSGRPRTPAPRSAARVEDRIGEIAGVAHDWAKSGPLHGLGALGDDAAQRRHINSTSMPSTIGPLRVASRNDAAKCAEAGIPSRGMINVVSASSMTSGPTVVTFCATRHAAGSQLAGRLATSDPARASCRRYMRAAMVEIRRLRRGAHRSNAPVDDLDLDALHDPVALFIFGFERRRSQSAPPERSGRPLSSTMMS